MNLLHQGINFNKFAGGSVLIILFIILPFELFAQSREDLKKFENLFAEDNHKHNWGSVMADSKNEFSFIFSALYVTYKEVLSSQDIDACVFTPSCSVYALESIKQRGIVAGFFDAMDRLTRCNPGGRKNIPLDPATGKYFDPVVPSLH